MPPVEAPEMPTVAHPSAMDAAFNALNELPGIDPSPEPKAAPAETPPAEPTAAPAPEVKVEPEKKAPEESEPDDDLPRAKKKEAVPPVPEKKADAKPLVKESVPELRRSYEATKTERDTLKSEVEKLRAEQKTWREAGKKEATAEVQSEIEQLRKQVAEYDVKVRYLNYAQSNEFKEKYQEPLKKAWQAAAADINGFKYTDAEGNEKEATVEDIAALMKMNATTAAIAAKRAFGDAAPEVLAHRRELIRLTQASEGALQEYRQKGSERSAEEARNQENAQKQAREFFDNHLGRLRTERAEFFGDDPEDKDGNEFIRKGDALVKKALLGEGIPEGITPQERAEIRIKAQAEVAARAAAFGRERHRYLRIKEENEALRAKIAAFEKSEPDPADPKSGKTGVKKTAWEMADESMAAIPGI